MIGTGYDFFFAKPVCLRVSRVSLIYRESFGYCGFVTESSIRLIYILNSKYLY